MSLFIKYLNICPKAPHFFRSISILFVYFFFNSLLTLRFYFFRFLDLLFFLLYPSFFSNCSLFISAYKKICFCSKILSRIHFIKSKILTETVFFFFSFGSCPSISDADDMVSYFGESTDDSRQQMDDHGDEELVKQAAQLSRQRLQHQTHSLPSPKPGLQRSFTQPSPPSSPSMPSKMKTGDALTPQGINRKQSASRLHKILTPKILRELKLQNLKELQQTKQETTSEKPAPTPTPSTEVLPPLPPPSSSASTTDTTTTTTSASTTSDSSTTMITIARTATPDDTEAVASTSSNTPSFTLASIIQLKRQPSSPTSSRSSAEVATTIYVTGTAPKALPEEIGDSQESSKPSRQKPSTSSRSTSTPNPQTPTPVRIASAGNEEGVAEEAAAQTPDPEQFDIPSAEGMEKVIDNERKIRIKRLQRDLTRIQKELQAR
ncbi:unnamed protein product [Acanthosepion pharaonis]|uniref:Uncharacterized protein n=1 Tax=Acanthosepion pharaonis TaxID=158019 RepID=A0A812E0W0_ACAPH|nr:unnamed protein product [Sepia pharaonis]